MMLQTMVCEQCFQPCKQLCQPQTSAWVEPFPVNGRMTGKYSPPLITLSEQDGFAISGQIQP